MADTYLGRVYGEEQVRYKRQCTSYSIGRLKAGTDEITTEQFKDSKTKLLKYSLLTDMEQDCGLRLEKIRE